jgi:hypothetical protein
MWINRITIRHPIWCDHTNVKIGDANEFVTEHKPQNQSIRSSDAILLCLVLKIFIITSLLNVSQASVLTVNKINGDNGACEGKRAKKQFQTKKHTNQSIDDGGDVGGGNDLIGGRVFGGGQERGLQQQLTNRVDDRLRIVAHRARVDGGICCRCVVT